MPAVNDFDTDEPAVIEMPKTTTEQPQTPSPSTSNGKPLAVRSLHNGRAMLFNNDCVDVLKHLKASTVDLTVTSPPYDNLRRYTGFTFDFEAVAQQLYRVTKPGGVVVWVVADATINGSETGTSFKQALYFKEIGFNLHDTMIWQKTSYPVPTQDRYYACFEYMFVFSKGKPHAMNFLCDRQNKTAGLVRPKETSIGHGKPKYDHTRSRIIAENGRRGNVWVYDVPHIATNHSATFPEQLARDHIISWSNPGDLVLDPFMGSGTTGKQALLLDRRFIGIELSTEYFNSIAVPRIQNAKQGA